MPTFNLLNKTVLVKAPIEMTDDAENQRLHDQVAKLIDGFAAQLSADLWGIDNRLSVEVES